MMLIRRGGRNAFWDNESVGAGEVSYPVNIGHSAENIAIGIKTSAPTVITVETTLNPSPNLEGIIPDLSSDPNEIQTVTINGSPTGGSFTLTFDGVTTSNIAYNASASTVQAALESLSNIKPGDVSVSGGPGPSTPFVIEFTGRFAGQNVPILGSSSSFTGGTSPNVVVTETRNGHQIWGTLYYIDTPVQITFSSAGSAFIIIPDFAPQYLRLKSSAAATITAGWEAST